MKKNIKKIICLGLTLIACVGGLCACNDGDKDNVYTNPQKLGDFYKLEEAYEQGFISHNDLLNIAYYNHQKYDFAEYEWNDPNFIPSLKNPETLSENTQNAIKETYAYNLKTQNDMNNISKDYIDIAYYYGTYNDWIVVEMRDRGIHVDAFSTIKIGEMDFTIADGFPIMVWKEL